MSSFAAEKNTGNIAGGHKAAIANPNVSQEAKERSRNVLEELESTGDLQQPDSEAGKNAGNVIGGHKATLKNPNVSDEAKDHSRAVLEQHEAI